MIAVVGLGGFAVALGVIFAAFVGFCCGVAWTVAVQKQPDELADFRRRQLLDLSLRHDDAEISSIRRHPAFFDQEEGQA